MVQLADKNENHLNFRIINLIGALFYECNFDYIKKMLIGKEKISTFGNSMVLNKQRILCQKKEGLKNQAQTFFLIHENVSVYSSIISNPSESSGQSMRLFSG